MMCYWYTNLVEENYYQNMYKRFYDANEIDHINFRWLQLLILTLYSKNNCIVYNWCQNIDLE